MQLKIGYLFQCPPRAAPWVRSSNNKVALKGQKLSISKLLPFQGDFLYIPYTQGAALG